MVRLPGTVQKWAEEARSYGLSLASSIHDDNRAYSSASQMDDPQYLLLRVLWNARPEHFELRDELARLFGNNLMGEADALLRKSPDWKAYLTTLPLHGESRTAAVKSIGLFTLVRWNQLVLYGRNRTDADDVYASNSLTPGRRLRPRVDQPGRYAEPQQTPTNAGKWSSPATIHSNYSTTVSQLSGIAAAAIAKDEQLVTAFRNGLMTAINMAAFGGRGLSHHHKINRRRFNFGEFWTAAVDGVDEVIDDENIVKAIYEDKRCRRSEGDRAIRRQEAGEMACWIYADEDPNQSCQNGVTHTEYILVGHDQNGRPLTQALHRRILISQDCDMLSVTVAEYDDRYIAYLRNTKAQSSLRVPTDQVFMTMKEYGPFNIFKRDQMESFGICYVALLLHWQQSSAAAASVRGLTTGVKGLNFNPNPPYRNRSKTPSIPSSSSDADSNPPESPSTQAARRQEMRGGTNRSTEQRGRTPLRMVDAPRSSSYDERFQTPRRGNEVVAPRSSSYHVHRRV